MRESNEKHTGIPRPRQEITMNQPIVRNGSNKHLLLEVAKTYPVDARDLSPKGCRYDLFQGVWLVNGNDELLIESKDVQPPRTKKMDIETGEDQKSE